LNACWCCLRATLSRWTLRFGLRTSERIRARRRMLRCVILRRRPRRRAGSLMVYTHVLDRGGKGVRSPVDRLEG